MLHRRPEVVRLLPPSELKLFDAARNDALKRLDPVQTRQCLDQARRLGAKYHAARPRNSRTVEKEAIFIELEARFYRRLEHIRALHERRRLKIKA